VAEAVQVEAWRLRGPGAQGRRCRRRAPALVVFDRDCREVTGEHYHREYLACGARWLEQCAR